LFPPGSDNLFRRYRQSFGYTDQIRFVIAKKFDDSTEHCRIAQSCPQSVWIKPGQVKKALRTRLLVQNPAERGKNKGLWIDPGIIGGCGLF
jgi:hypothetical protein